MCFQAFSAMEQLRTHCATEISQLERIVGSQEELFAALNHTYPELVTEDRLKTKHLFSIHLKNEFNLCFFLLFSPTNTVGIKPCPKWNAEFCIWHFVNNHRGAVQFDERSMFKMFFLRDSNELRSLVTIPSHVMKLFPKVTICKDAPLAIIFLSFQSLTCRYWFLTIPIFYLRKMIDSLHKHLCP